MNKVQARELARAILTIGNNYSLEQKVDIAEGKILNAIPENKVVVVRHKFDDDFLSVLKKVGNKARTYN